MRVNTILYVYESPWNVDFKLNCAVYIPLRRTVVADDALCPPCTYAITFDGSVIDLHVYEYGNHLIPEISSKKPDMLDSLILQG